MIVSNLQSCINIIDPMLYFYHFKKVTVASHDSSIFTLSETFFSSICMLDVRIYIKNLSREIIDI